MAATFVPTVIEFARSAVLAGPASRRVATASASADSAFCGMMCVVIAWLASCGQLCRAAALSSGAGELVQQVSSAHGTEIPAFLSGAVARAAGALIGDGLASHTLASAGFAAVAAAGSSPGLTAASLALIQVARRLRVPQRSDGAAAVPACAKIVLQVAAGLSRAVRQHGFEPSAAAALADGEAIAALLLAAATAEQSCVAAAIDAGAAVCLPNFDERLSLEAAVDAAAAEMKSRLSPTGTAAATADAVLSLAADAWDLLSAEGRARVDAALDDPRAVAIMMRHTSTDAALRFHVALCCDTSDVDAAAARLKRAVLQWGLMTLLAQCIPEPATSSEPTDVAALAREMLCGSFTAPPQGPALSRPSEREVWALRLLHASLASDTAEACSTDTRRSRAMQFLLAPPGHDLLQVALDSKAFDACAAAIEATAAHARGRRSRIYYKKNALDKWIERHSFMWSGDNSYSGAATAQVDSSGVTGARKAAASRAAHPCFGTLAEVLAFAAAQCQAAQSHGRVCLDASTAVGDAPADAISAASSGAVGAAGMFSAASSSSRASTVSQPAAATVSSPAVSLPLANATAWWEGLWRVWSDDGRDFPVLRSAVRGVGAGLTNLIHCASALILRGAVAESDSELDEHRTRTIAVLSALKHLGIDGNALWGRAHSERTAAILHAATAVTAAADRGDVADAMLPLLATATALHASAGSMSAVTAAVCGAFAGVLSAQGAAASGAVAASAAFFYSHLVTTVAPSTHSASETKSPAILCSLLSVLQTDSPLPRVFAAGRAALVDAAWVGGVARAAEMASQLATLMQWLAGLPAEQGPLGAALLSQAGAVPWLADALFVAEDDSAAGSAQVLQKLLAAAHSASITSLNADVVASGAAATLMRLCRLAPMPQHGGRPHKAAAALQQLKMGAPSQGLGSASAALGASQVLRLALAARASTWRRRRHAVLGRAMALRGECRDPARVSEEEI